MAAQRLMLLYAMALALSRCAGALRPHFGTEEPGDGPELTSCAPLKMQGSFSTVEVGVGTPPQVLDLIVDTGSDVVLVEDCVCEDEGNCHKDNRCFHHGGEGTSKSFDYPRPLKGITITYGSGPIDTVIGSDVVTLGNISVQMESLLLIENNRLAHGLQVEGILGLGLPNSEQSLSQEKGFLDEASVSSFSMCFNSFGQSGSLFMGSRAVLDTPLGIVGQQHWGVKFGGVSVGSAPTEFLRAEFCDASKGDACSAIADSGSTLIMGPQDHLMTLFSNICDAWNMCKVRRGWFDSLQDHSEAATKKRKASALFAATSDCRDLQTMPSLRFHVNGKSDGEEDMLDLSPEDYMIETDQNTGTWLDIVERLLGVSAKACRPAFMPFDFVEKGVGPAWVFGAPFFYKFNVAYDRAATPPAISFNRATCESCEGAGGSAFIQPTNSRRTLLSAPRMPSFAATRELRSYKKGTWEGAA